MPIDIIEKIIGDTIVDETDAYADSAQEVKVQRTETFEWARLRLLDTKIVDELLSPSEVKAVTAHFRMNYAETVKLLTDVQLARLVATTPVSNLETAKQEVGESLPSDLLYKKGQPCNTCTLILGGKVTILVGAEDFRSDLSSWAVLGKSALENSEYVPDFTAFVSDGPCRCLRLTREAFSTAVDASASERTATEKKAPRRASLTTSAEGGGSIGENGSQSSAEVPNRREKLLAKLLSNQKIRSPSFEDVQPVVKETVVRFDDTKTNGTPAADTQKEEEGANEDVFNT